MNKQALRFGISALVIAAILFCVVTAMDYNYCRKFAAQIEMPYKYQLVGGCFLQVAEGAWVNIDSYRLYQLTNP